jgi:MscS family membrane protein
MVFLDPRVREWAVSLAILLGSYLGARVVSFLLGRALASAVRRTSSTLDDRLLAALTRPVTYSLFLIGAYVAVHRVPMAPHWVAPIDGALFVVAVVLVTLSLVRSYGIVLTWYTSESGAATSELAAEFGPLASKLGKTFLTLVAVITVLQHFEVNVASLVVSLGVGSLAVGLAAQDTLANMFAGFTLLVDRPFRIGDRIRLASGEQGDVLTIGMRATLIRTPEETILVVPNSLLIKERLINLSRPSRSVASTVDLALPYGTDLERAKAVLSEATAASALVSPQPGPTILVQRFGDWALHLSVGFHARDYAALGQARSDVQERVYAALRAAGIELAMAPRPAAAPPEAGRPA